MAQLDFLHGNKIIKWYTYTPSTADTHNKRILNYTKCSYSS